MYCKTKKIEKKNIFEVFPNSLAFSIIYQGGLIGDGGHPYHEFLKILLQFFPEFFYQWILNRKMKTFIEN